VVPKLSTITYKQTIRLESFRRSNIWLRSVDLEGVCKEILQSLPVTQLLVQILPDQIVMSGKKVKTSSSVRFCQSVAVFMNC
jgi:hypothetical protein